MKLLLPLLCPLLLRAPMLAVAMALAASAAVAAPVPAEEGSVAEGRQFAEANCARCHAIVEDDESPMTAAPPFRILHENYPVEHLAEALAEGIITGHPEMPEFQLMPEQIDSFISYLKTLE